MFEKTQNKWKRNQGWSNFSKKVANLILRSLNETGNNKVVLWGSLDSLYPITPSPFLLPRRFPEFDVSNVNVVSLPIVSSLIDRPIAKMIWIILNVTQPTKFSWNQFELQTAFTLKSKWRHLYDLFSLQRLWYLMKKITTKCNKYLVLGRWPLTDLL